MHHRLSPAPFFEFPVHLDSLPFRSSATHIANGYEIEAEATRLKAQSGRNPNGQSREPRAAIGLAQQFPAVGSVQSQLTGNPEKALQVLKDIADTGVPITAGDILYARKLNLAAFLNLHGRLPASAKGYLGEFIPWSDSLANQLKITTAATAPTPPSATPQSLNISGHEDAFGMENSSYLLLKNDARPRNYEPTQIRQSQNYAFNEPLGILSDPIQITTPFAQLCLDELDRKLGSWIAQQLLSAGVSGWRGEYGILALSQSLHETAGGRPLLPQQLLYVTAVLNDMEAVPDTRESFPLALRNIEHLAICTVNSSSVYTPVHRGSYLIDAAVRHKYHEYDWAHDVANAIHIEESLESQMWLKPQYGGDSDKQPMRTRKNQLQMLFEEHLLASESNHSEGMLDAWARLHAVGASLAMVPGMNLRGLKQVDASWAELVQRGPSVERLDIAVIYPEIYELLLRELRRMREPLATSEVAASPEEPFFRSKRFTRLYSALFPAWAPVGLKDALLEAVMRRAFPDEGIDITRPRDPTSHHQTLHAAARTIALDPEFFMIGGRLRTDLAFEAFHSWLSQTARTNPDRLINGLPLGMQNLDGIERQLRQTPDAHAALVRLLMMED